MKQQKAPCNALEAAGAGERDVDDLAEFGRSAAIAGGEHRLGRLVHRKRFAGKRFCERHDKTRLQDPSGFARDRLVIRGSRHPPPQSRGAAAPPGFAPSPL